MYKQICNGFLRFLTNFDIVYFSQKIKLFLLHRKPNLFTVMFPHSRLKALKFLNSVIKLMKTSLLYLFFCYADKKRHLNTGVRIVQSD